MKPNCRVLYENQAFETLTKYVFKFYQNPGRVFKKIGLSFKV
jgi:hypothetical protein